MTRPAATVPVLAIDGLTTVFPGVTGPTVIVDDISLAVHRGETLAVVGESGSGKTMAFHSALGLVPHPGRVQSGRVLLDGVDLVKLTPDELRRRRGAEIAIVFQDPLTALNPVFTIGDQISEVCGRICLSARLRHASERSRSWPACIFRTRIGGWTIIRINSRVECASVH